MLNVCDAAYVMTASGSGISQTTRASLDGVVVRGAALPTLGKRPFELLAWRARDEGVKRLLLLVDGEQVDLPSLVAASVTGDPGPPELVSAPSVADDALTLSVPRLLSPATLGDLRWEIETGSPGAGRWRIRQPPLHTRCDDAVTAWARSQARALSVLQYQPGISPCEEVLLARLLLLAGEYDAVLIRAQRGLAHRRSALEAAAWARLAVAGAMAAARPDGAVDPLRRWGEEVAGTPEEALVNQWSFVLAEAQGLASEALSRWAVLATRPGSCDAAVDPWTLVHRRALAQRSAHIATETLRTVAKMWEGTDQELAARAAWWRQSGGDATEMVQGWPTRQFDVLVSSTARGLGTDPGWWLVVAEALHRRSPLPDDLLKVTVARAAAIGADAAVRWAMLSRSSGRSVPSPLDLRAVDASLPGLERLAAALVRFGEVGNQRRSVVVDALSALEPQEVDTALALVEALEPGAADLALSVLKPAKP